MIGDASGGLAERPFLEPLFQEGDEVDREDEEDADELGQGDEERQRRHQEQEAPLGSGHRGILLIHLASLRPSGG